MTIEIVSSTKNILDFKDVIVNAANNRLEAGGGVCGVIHKAAGPLLALECRDIMKRRRKVIPTGSCVLTCGFHAAQHIIHAVGPVFASYDKPVARKLLSKAYTSVLTMCKNMNAKQVVIPAISTGIYGFPIQEACVIAINACTYFQINNPNCHTQVVLSAFTPEVKYWYDECEIDPLT